MTKNVFMTSMYFFLPIALDEKSLEKGKIEKISHVEPYGFLCNLQSSLDIYTLKDSSKEFSIKDPKSNIAKNTPIVAKHYTLKYCPQIGGEYYWFFVFGVELNGEEHGVFNSKENLVGIKKAIYDNSLMYSNESLHDWLNKDLSDLGCTEANLNDIRYSSVDIRGIKSSNAFQDAFFSDDKPNIADVFGDNYYQFAYGLLRGNDNFCQIEKYSLSDNMTEITPIYKFERFYSALHGMVSLHTCYPFGDKENAKNGFLEAPFEFVKQVPCYEMCYAIMLDRELERCNKQVRDKNEAHRIKLSLALLEDILYQDVFQQDAHNNKMCKIFQSWNFYNRYKQIDRYGNRHAEATDTKFSQQFTKMAFGVSFLSLVTTIFNLSITLMMQGYVKLPKVLSVILGILIAIAVVLILVLAVCIIVPSISNRKKKRLKQK